MRVRNDHERYGLISILLHWTMAALVIGLFFLGRYMVDLDYYHPWYHRAPDIHRGLGVLSAILLVVRLAWRLGNPRPGLLGSPWEQRAALWVHRLFYLLMAATVVAGYLLTTADGRGVDVFGWFEVPATLHGVNRQEDLAGDVHKWLANGLMGLAVLHTLAALKHHFVDRDATLRRMLWPGRT